MKEKYIPNKATLLLGVPYKFGARNPHKNAVDCSGYVGYILEALGFVGKYFKYGYNCEDLFKLLKPNTTIADIGQAGFGDLLFFENEGILSHVAIFIKNKGNGIYTILDSSSDVGVQIRNFDTKCALYNYLTVPWEHYHKKLNNKDTFYRSLYRYSIYKAKELWHSLCTLI